MTHQHEVTEYSILQLDPSHIPAEIFHRSVPLLLTSSSSSSSYRPQVNKPELHHGDEPSLPCGVETEVTLDVSYLDGDEHLVLGGTEIITLCQEDLPEGAFSELPLQHDVPPLYVLHVCGGQKRNVGSLKKPS